MRIILTAAACLSVIAAAEARQDDADFNVTEVAPGLYNIMGVGGFTGGNIGLFTGEDGAILIDDSMPPFSDKLMAAIASVTDQTPKFVINTHYHFDHTGGNLAMEAAGAIIVAHDNVRARLVEGGVPLGEDGANIDAPKEFLPVVTFSKSLTFHLNGVTTHVMHPNNAHTDGDSMIHFKEINAVHMGDAFFHEVYPYIDVDGGGGIDGYIAAQEMVHAHIKDDTAIIPGHGPMATRADLAENIAMLRDIRNKIAALKAGGASEDEAVAAAPTADYDEAFTWGFINGERITRAIYRSLP